MGTDPGADLVEVIDAAGSVLRVVTRREMRDQNLLHRSVYVVVFHDIDGSVSLCAHQRSVKKDVNPGYWDLAFGGVCDPGESWDEAATRELREEAGITEQMRSVSTRLYHDSQVSVLGNVFVSFSGGPFTFIDGEVTAHEWVPVNQVRPWLKNRPVCSDSVGLVMPMLERVGNRSSIPEIKEALGWL